MDRKPLTKDERLDVLTDAIETNAIGYWANDYGTIKISRNDEYQITNATFYAINEKGEKEFYRLTPALIQTGINRVLDPTFQVRDDIRQSVQKNDNDAESCDVIIQAALFGEIIYG